MTVAELIAELQKMPQDAEVRYYDGEGRGGWRTASTVEASRQTFYHPRGTFDFADIS